MEEDLLSNEQKDLVLTSILSAVENEKLKFKKLSEEHESTLKNLDILIDALCDHSNYDKEFQHNDNDGHSKIAITYTYKCTCKRCGKCWREKTKSDY